MSSLPIEQINNIATDGIGFMLGDVINSRTDAEYGLWMYYHLRTCKIPSVLGCSLYGLYIGKKL